MTSSNIYGKTSGVDLQNNLTNYLYICILSTFLIFSTTPKTANTTIGMKRGNKLGRSRSLGVYKSIITLSYLTTNSYQFPPKLYNVSVGQNIYSSDNIYS